MIEKTYKTELGTIHYWLSREIVQNHMTIVFLPGLTADHRLFDKQIVYFKRKPQYNLFVWDAPGHAASRPFTLDFDLNDKARWLSEILSLEGIVHPVIVGQSMGGYVGQAFAQLYPDRLEGFISIDSAPLERSYTDVLTIWMLKKVEAVYRMYPWKSLLKAGSNGVATSEYGKQLMLKMMMEYNQNHQEYVRLVGHGYRMLAQAMEQDCAYEIPCPSLLICGEKDRAGSAKRYNKRWHAKSGIPILWLEDAGHNSNTDSPEVVNTAIEYFLLEKSKKI